MVYNDRPSVCRTNNVLSEALSCSTHDGTEKPIRILNTFEADMLVMSSFINSHNSGAMPNLLAARLNIHKYGRSAAKKVFPGQHDL